MPTPLESEFHRMRYVHHWRYSNIRVGVDPHDPDRWYAVVSVIGGGVGGEGETPEAAIAQAVTNYIALDNRKATEPVPLKPRPKARRKNRRG